MREINGFWVDENNNRWTVATHTEWEANMKCATLKGCRDCLDCWYCVGCVECSACHGCKDCRRVTGGCNRVGVVGFTYVNDLPRLIAWRADRLYAKSGKGRY